MGQLAFEVHRLLIICLVLVACVGKESSAQQQYGDPTGYKCSDTKVQSCNAFILYRAQLGYVELSSIAQLFNSNASAIAKSTNITTTHALNVSDAVFIPVTCRCLNNTSMVNISYIIQSGDTFYNVNINNFESLSTTTAIVAANDIDSTQLMIGDAVTVPIRCACPSVAQTADGTTSLVTYPVIFTDELNEIGPRFGVSTADIMAANLLTEPDVFFRNTLLVPINTSLPTYTASAPADNSFPSPAPSPSPIPQSGD